jgi:hypothetical protein
MVVLHYCNNAFCNGLDPPSILATVGWKYLRHEKARWRITKSSIATNTSLLYVTIVVQL